MPNLVTKLTFAALLAGATSTALAAPGDGVRLGGSDGRLHPFIELEARYDSKAYIDPNATPPIEASDVIIHVRPGFKLDVPGETTSVDLSASLDIAQYLGNDNPVTKDLSKVYAEAELGIGVNKKGVVSLEVNDSFRRSDRPEALSFGAGVVSNYNVLEVRVPWRPGGGALTLNANGGWSMETYQAMKSDANCASAAPGDPLCNLSDFGYDQLNAGAGVTWKFLPRTSALLEGGYFKRMPKLASAADPAGYRLNAGLTGLVTPHIAATLKAGYGSTTAVTPALSTWLGTAEVEWIPSETTSLRLGYGHDLAVDPAAQYQVDRVSLFAKQLVAGRFAFACDGRWEHLAFPSGGGSADVLTVTPSAGVEVTRWLRTELAYAYTDRSTSSTKTLFGVRSYSKNEVWLKVVATY